MDPIWFQDYELEFLNGFRNSNMGGHLGIEFLEIGPNFLTARMPVDERTTQPFGLLHGGASCVLSESLGSVGAWMCIDPNKNMAVGIEINANHVRSATEGFVTGIARPLHTGRSIHVWQTEITNDKDKLVCISRLTVAIKDKPAS